MKEEIMVSILCLAYNHEEYIRQCLDGFVMQKTNFKFEVLIHDDASTDNTAKIIREYEAKYPEIIKPIYQTENQLSQGKKIVNNILTPLAKGKYVALCEGDDFWTDENKLQLQVEALNSHPECKMCVHKVKVLFENQDKVSDFPPFELKSGIIESYDFIKMTESYIFQTSSYFFDGELFRTYANENLEFKRLSPVGDVCFLFYFGCKAPVYYVDKEMSCYRKESIGSWCDNIKKNGQEKFRIHNERMIQVIKEFDKYAEGKYHLLMQRRIVARLCLEGSYKKIFKKEFREARKSFLLKTRLHYFLRAYFPRIMKLLNK